MIKINMIPLHGIDIENIGHIALGQSQTELIQLLTEKNNGHVDPSEANHCFTFLNISVGIWRQYTEQDVMENITEMKKNNEYLENQDWLLADLDKAKHFLDNRLR